MSPKMQAALPYCVLEAQLEGEPSALPIGCSRRDENGWVLLC